MYYVHVCLLLSEASPLHFWHDTPHMALRNWPVLLGYSKTTDRKYALRSDKWVLCVTEYQQHVAAKVPRHLKSQWMAQKWMLQVYQLQWWSSHCELCPMELKERCKSTSDTTDGGQRNLGVISDHKHGLNARPPVMARDQNTRHVDHRHQHLNRMRAEWFSVLFLDKNRFNLTITDGQKWCWRCQEECYAAVTKSPDGHLGLLVSWCGKYASVFQNWSPQSGWQCDYYTVSFNILFF